jgi:hypothetical protein
MILDFIKIIDVINICHFKSLFQAVSIMVECDTLMNEIKKSNFEYFVYELVNKDTKI